MFSAGIISYSSENYTFHFKALAEDSVITPKYTNSGWTLEYSADKSTRTSISSWSSFTIPAWETRYMRGSGFSTNSLFASVLSTNARTISKPVECHWNINELINYINPPTTLADYCYASMFEWCTSLTTAPSLPATTMADYCYYGMFNNCTSLTTAPTLPATTMSAYCYSYMFYWCSSLTTAPSLPATTLAYFCYTSMFEWCVSLTTAPSLPATTLDSYCYSNMFSRCISLTTAPELPATTLADSCYYGMFYWCASFKVSATLTWSYDESWRIPTSWTGGVATDWNTDMLYGTWWTFTSDPNIDTIYYTENPPA